MRRFIITGAPGAGKTAIIRQLELDGFSVVEEAATDVIAAAQAQGRVQPWTHPSFIDAIAALQRQRQVRASRETGDLRLSPLHREVCWTEWRRSSVSLYRGKAVHHGLMKYRAYCKIFAHIGPVIRELREGQGV